MVFSHNNRKVTIIEEEIPSQFRDEKGGIGTDTNETQQSLSNTL